MVVGTDGMPTETSFDTQVRQEVVGQRAKVHGAALLGEVYSPRRGPP
jgi:predicted regulator of Ras-like GTPase activity (Roadblock/LC7/MglB family)